MPEQSIEHKTAEAQKHGERWHDRGPTWKHARRLYLKYPLLPAADIAHLLGVSRQVVYEHIEGLMGERKKLREEALVKLKEKEGL